ncbi:MAG: hypothetical protein KAS32_23960 [Candidatus Peribacteraceae bacterium]|nr:hypothetical protein [Candidatus Peribacteraceae bacterium]
MAKNINIEYLGGGVYAKWENGMIALSVNDHRNHPVVFLELNEIKTLNSFVARMQRKENENHE